jgi:hypothetical protein
MAAGRESPTGDDRPAVHRHPANWRQQRRAQLAEPDRFGQASTTRPWISGSIPPTSSRRREYLRRLGRGILYGPGPHQFRYVSCPKRFSIGGRANAEFRWDVFNLFNHPGFGFPNAAIGNPTVGRITTTVVDNRSMQFALKVNF